MGTIEQLKEYAQQVEAKGYAQVRFRLSPAVLYLIAANRRRGESVGMVLERLLVGTPVPVDPKTAARAAAKAARRGANRRKHQQERLDRMLGRRSKRAESTGQDRCT